MSGEPNGFKAADLIQIWIGLAVSLSALFAWLTYRLQRGGFLLNVPHLTAWATESDPALIIHFSLNGAGADQWVVKQVVLTSPRSAHFLKLTQSYDAFGGVVHNATGEKIGRKVDYRGGAVAVSSADRVKLRVKIALKASPSVTSWRTAFISK